MVLGNIDINVFTFFSNGINIRLPEFEVEQALTTLARLDREKNLLARDITAIDLRLPGRVTVRLSDEAFAARQEAEKKAKAKARREA